MSRPAIAKNLTAIRQQLEIMVAVATCIVIALKAQGADCNPEAAKALQRCVCDPLSVQMEAIDWIVGTVR